jgi:hypothetical protein
MFILLLNGEGGGWGGSTSKKAVSSSKVPQYPAEVDRYLKFVDATIHKIDVMCLLCSIRVIRSL